MISCLTLDLTTRLSPSAMLNAGAGLADHFNAIFAPFAGEFDLAEKHPGSAAAFDNLVPYQELMAELDHAAQAELELIRTKIVDPLKEFKEVVRGVRKRITKREHKVLNPCSILAPSSVLSSLCQVNISLTFFQLIDYDRHNLSLTKLREKRDKNLSDEKKLFKVTEPPVSCGITHARCSSNKILRPLRTSSTISTMD